jgi:hypothetical protein
MATSHDKPGKQNSLDDDMRPEYDFRTMTNVVRGKYATLIGETLQMIRLDDDIAAAFPDEDSVNDALREYLRIQKLKQSRKRKHQGSSMVTKP